MNIIGFTVFQEEWIKERDDQQCQIEECHSIYNLEVRHIIPKDYAFNVLHWKLREINSPFNGITLCSLFYEEIYLEDNEKWEKEYKIYLKRIAKERTLKFLRKKPYPYPYLYRLLEQNNQDELNYNL